VTITTAEIPRLGDTTEWGSLMLRMLELQGWQVTVRPLFGDSGVLVLAERDRVVVYRQGNTVADVACDLFQDATNRQQTTPRRTRVSSPAPDCSR
jgi:hypothetical protein